MSPPALIPLTISLLNSTLSSFYYTYIHAFIYTQTRSIYIYNIIQIKIA